MTLALLVGVALGFFGSIPIAGPASFLVLKNALEKGSRAGLDIAVGAAVGESGYAGVALWGLTSALLRFPFLASIAKVVGAVLIIVMGVYLVVRKTSERSRRKASEMDDQGRRWLRGFASAIFNPTLIVTWTSVVTALHATNVFEMSPSSALPFALGVGAGITAWFWLLVKLVHRFRAQVENGGLDRVVRGMGWAMIAIGIVVGGRVVLLTVSVVAGEMCSPDTPVAWSSGSIVADRRWSSLLIAADEPVRRALSTREGGRVTRTQRGSR